VQVQFKKKETAKSLAAKKRSLQKQAEEEEPWKDLNFVELNVLSLMRCLEVNRVAG
jgi:hypothetical protein